MKNKKLSYIVVPLIVAIFLIPVDGYSIKISFYLGKVKLTRSGKKANVKIGDELKSGDKIKTGKRSIVELTYKDGSKLKIKQNSTVKIGSKIIKGSNNVSLIAGNLTGTFTKLRNSKRKVYTPTIVCAIRGTEFNMGVSKGGDTRIELTEGKLNLNNPYGSKDIVENQNVRSSASKDPRLDDDKSSMDDWENNRNQKFEKNPNKYRKDYSKYMRKFKSRNRGVKKDLKRYNRNMDNQNSETINETEKDIERTEENVEDDLMLNENSNLSIDGIIEDFKTRKKRMYRRFLKVKRESNRVLAQQRRNYMEIQKVREAFLKARQEIRDKFQSDKDRILKFDKNKFKPNFNKGK